jgi:hypothetical protein
VGRDWFLGGRRDRPQPKPLAFAKFPKIFRIFFPDFPLYGV